MHAARAILACVVMAAQVPVFACKLAPAASPALASPSAIRYDARVSGPDPWALDVEATFEGGADQLVAQAPAGVVSVEVEDASGARTVLRAPGAKDTSGVESASASASTLSADPYATQRSWKLGCKGTCRVRYRYDLTRAAELAGDSIDVAIRSGSDVLSPGSTWLLRPAPLAAHVPVRLQVRTDAGVKIACAFAPDSDAAAENARAGAPRSSAGAQTEVRSYTLRSEDLVTAGYTVFGGFTALRVERAGGVLDVAVLGGRRTASDDLLERWVSVMAATLDAVYGRFPVKRAQLVLVPVHGSRSVDFGRTLPAGGASIAMLFGSEAGEEELFDDWILTHELFHLGVPSFFREGRWLDEGLATYYEPLLRTRAGLRSDVQLWTEFAREMPRGLAQEGELSLIDTTRHDRVYWGGAMFALEADLRIRARTGGQRSLDDGLRSALDQGADATRVWSLDAYLRAIDGATRVPVMRELYERAEQRSRLDPCAPGRMLFAPDAEALPTPKPAPLGLEAPKPAPLGLEAPWSRPAWIRASSGSGSGSDLCAPSEEEVFRSMLDALGVKRTDAGAILFDDGAALAHVRRNLTGTSSTVGRAKSPE